MIDLREQHEWLKEWVKDDPDGLGIDLETRLFNATEVEMIMQIYTDEKLPKFNISTDEILEFNNKRFVSNTTGMNCSKCGADYKVNNRRILPFEFETLNEHIGKIWIPCPRCEEKYDLGICRYY